MNQAPTPGSTGTAKLDVSEGNTALAVGSGSVPMLATPEVVALVERAAVAAVDGTLDEGTTTVGSRVELDHLAPTPVGASAEATARLESVDGRRLEFSFEVTDPAGVVARGRHLRVIVDAARFTASAKERAGG